MMSLKKEPEIMLQQIETTAGEATAELQRRGIDLSNRVKITVDAGGDHFAAARAAARPLVMAAGWSDEDIDVLIERARAEIAAEDA
jgi:hypothetical protein